MPSDHFTNFLTSFERMSHEWRDDFDIPALQRLTGDERTEAVRRLVERLREGTDPRAVRALDAISFEGLERLLREVFPISREEARIEIAATLYRLTELDEDAASIVAGLTAESVYVRQQAASKLANIPPRLAREALLVALEDVDAKVRAAAARTLLAQLGIFTDPLSLLGLVEHELATESAQIRSEARRDLIPLLDALDRGEVLDSSWTTPMTTSPLYKRFLQSMCCRPGHEPWPDRLAIDDIESMSDHERRRIRFTVLFLIQRRDPRAPAALAVVLEDAAVVLEGALETATEPMRAAITSALDSLASPSTREPDYGCQ